MTTLIIGNLYRDLTNKRSVVTLTWEDEPEKRLGLILPFDCTPENLKAETEKAVRALAKELETATIRSA
jgi:uncharacterized protein (DUF924 family)